MAGKAMKIGLNCTYVVRLGFQSSGGMNRQRSDDVTGSTLGLYTDLTHKGP
jgi:hypothetical protein